MNIIEKAGHDISEAFRERNDLRAENARLRKVAEAAREVENYLQKYGASIVPHLLDTDENPGQRLREALADLDAKKEG